MVGEIYIIRGDNARRRRILKIGSENIESFNIGIDKFIIV